MEAIIGISLNMKPHGIGEDVKRYWHYTIVNRLASILNDMEIKVTDIGVNVREMPGVWISTNPIWEETVRKTLQLKTGELTEPLSRDDLFKRGISPVRIEINPNLVSMRKWKNHKKKSGISKQAAKKLEDIAKVWGANPEEWYVSYKPIPEES